MIRTAAADMMTPTPKCDLPRDQWPGTVDIHLGGQLSSGQRLVAKDNLSTLVMQPDGNLVLSLINDKGGPNQPIWYSATYGNPGAYAPLQDDGNFVVHRNDGGPGKGGALWATGTWGQ